MASSLMTRTHFADIMEPWTCALVREEALQGSKATQHLHYTQAYCIGPKHQ
jgi:hypothetical protein